MGEGEREGGKGDGETRERACVRVREKENRKSTNSINTEASSRSLLPIVFLHVNSREFLDAVLLDMFVVSRVYLNNIGTQPRLLSISSFSEAMTDCFYARDENEKKNPASARVRQKPTSCSKKHSLS